jgi:hypothetical protein
MLVVKSLSSIALGLMLFYGQVISGAKMPNLMYMTTFSNQVEMNIGSFSTSAEWKELIAMENIKIIFPI